MRKEIFKYFFTLIFAFSLINADAQKNRKILYTVKKIYVAGNCNMCKSLIEKTVNSLDGVKYSRWNSHKKIMKVKFNFNKVSIEDIQRSIANKGYDTELFKATDESYNDLHYCCKYPRE